MDNIENTNNVFGDKGPLTPEEIRKYKEGELNAQQLHDIEEKIMQSDLESDAVDGFQEFPEAVNLIAKNKSEFFNQNNIKPPASSRNAFIIISALTLVVILVTVISLKSFNKDNIEIAQINTIDTLKQDKVITIPQVLDTIQAIEIAQMTPKEKEEQIKPVVLKQESIEILQKTIAEETEIELEKIPIENLEQFRNEPKVLKFIEMQKMPTLFYSDLKVIDYSGHYTNPIDVLTFKFSGTPANMESDSSEVFTDGKIEKVAYLNYLEKAMAKFADGDYKSALSMYKTILKHYEEDENAYFYGGLCLYNLNRPKTALEYFNKVHQSGYFIFNQEALWFKAKCLYDIGKVDETKNVLNLIITQNGFYTNKAKEFLNKIK